MSTNIAAAPAPARERHGAAWLFPAAQVLPYLAFLAAAYSVFCVTADDPFITYRYAANLWAGHGLVFNVGERVEGFTSPLHLLLIVLLLKILPSVAILFKAKLLGLVFGLLAIFQTGLLARQTGLGRWGALLAQMLVAANTNVALGAVNGLETTLYVCLVLAALSAFLLEINAPAPRAFSAGWLFLAWATRPDALAIFLLLALVRVAWARRHHRRLPEILLWLEAFLIPALVLEVARVCYYHQLVPNTYFAKQVLLSVGLTAGWQYLLHPLFPLPINWPAHFRWGDIHGSFWAIFSLMIFWSLAGLGLVRLRRTWAGAALAAVALALIVFVLRFGGDWMPGWRFLLPAVPALAILQCHGLRAFTRVRGRGVGFGRIVAPVLVLALWAACAFVVPHNPWSNAHWSTRDGALLSADNAIGRKWVACSQYLRQSVLPGSFVAYSEMGYAGYKNMDLTFIDVRGLTDPEIARLPARYKGPWGVDDDDWFQPGDPLGAILQRRQPAMILAFSSALTMPKIALGRYYFVRYVGDPHDSSQVIFPALAYSEFGTGQ